MPVHDDVACAAIAVGAAFLRAGQPDDVAQALKEGLAGFSKELDLVSVDRCRDDGLGRRPGFHRNHVAYLGSRKVAGVPEAATFARKGSGHSTPPYDDKA
jgi:hypothetical protein